MDAKEEFMEPWVYRVFFKDNKPVMGVLAGGVGLYEKQITLSMEQYEIFRKNRQIAKDFAKKISSSS